jgi:hypothetical protein
VRLALTVATIGSGTSRIEEAKEVTIKFAPGAVVMAVDPSGQERSDFGVAGFCAMWGVGHVALGIASL